MQMESSRPPEKRSRMSLDVDQSDRFEPHSRRAWLSGGRGSERLSGCECALQTTQLRSVNRRPQHQHTDSTLSSQIWKCTQRPACAALATVTAAVRTRKETSARSDPPSTTRTRSPATSLAVGSTVVVPPLPPPVRVVWCRCCPLIDRLISHGERQSVGRGQT